MAKSFCSGCKHWKCYKPKPYDFDSKRFHYCDKNRQWELEWRKKLCNDKYKEK